MSTMLPPINLTGALVGQQFILDFNQFSKFNPAHISQNANLEIFNESGCGLNVTMQQSGHTKYVAAGLWGVIPIEPNDSQALLTVSYVLPNPPVSLLTAVYYAPGEPVSPGYTLGNSPIGIGGTVNTSGVQTLSNEGNTINTLVFDAGPTSHAQLLEIWNDHFLLNVLQSGVVHSVLQGNISGNPLQLGQLNDVTEVLGQLTIDQLLAVAGAINPNATSFSAISGNTSGTATLWMPFQGSAFKLVLCFLNNYKDSANHSIALPTAFVNDVGFIVFGDLGVSGDGGFAIQVGAVNQTLDIWTGLALAGGTAGTQTGLFKHSIGHVNVGAAVDHIQVNLSTNPHTGLALFVGN